MEGIQRGQSLDFPKNYNMGARTTISVMNQARNEIKANKAINMI